MSETIPVTVTDSMRKFLMNFAGGGQVVDMVWLAEMKKKKTTDREIFKAMRATEMMHAIGKYESAFRLGFIRKAHAIDQKHQGLLLSDFAELTAAGWRALGLENLTVGPATQAEYEEQRRAVLRQTKLMFGDE
jgi:hypothetical protein